jgi:hypothetical protein
MATETRHSDAAIPEGAPVFSSTELVIEAPVETVWGVLTAIGDWPSWNPDVKSVSIEGPVFEGATFRWKAGPGTIRSTIVSVDQPRLIAWTGKSLGIKAVHVWRLEQRNGTTLVRTEESYEGLVARSFRRSLQKKLDMALVAGLRHLKTEAEKTAPSTR